MIKGIIFDMDGTLVDNRDAHIEAFLTFCKRYNIYFENDDASFMLGLGNNDVLQMIFKRDISKEELNKLSNELEEVYRDIYSATIEPIDGLVSLLDDIKNSGLKMAIGSSGIKKNVDFVVERCHLEEYFDIMIDGDMVENAKPAPDIFSLAIERMGIKPSECVIFEDSFAGIEAARRAGCKVVVLATTHDRSQLTDYDILIDDFTQINLQQIAKLVE